MKSSRMGLTLLFCFAVSSCVSLYGVQYDEALVNGLNDYNKSAAAFLKKAQLSAIRFGTPPANDFYAASAGTLAGLQLRADIAGGKSQCRTAALAARALSATEEAIDAASERLGVGENPLPDASGSCLSIAVRNVKLAQDILEADHKEEGVLTSFVANLHEDEIQAAVRVAVQTVQAWKQ